MRKKLIVVLGMHRGGTSVITRSLQVMGVDLGDKFLPSQEDNITGFWEDLDIYTFNLEILDSLNSDWHVFTPIQAIDVVRLRERGYIQQGVNLLLKKTSGVKVFGFKDPRVAKLLPFWKEVFSKAQLNVSYVLAIRHPISVCKSLEKRNGFDFEKSSLIWLEHIISSLAGTMGKNCIVVDYDRLLISPDTELEKVAKKLDLQITPSELIKFKTEFLDKKLRHTVYQLDDLIQNNSILTLIKEVYSTLLDIASDKLQFDDRALKKLITQWSNEYFRLKPVLVFANKLDSRITAITTEYSKQVADLNTQVADLNTQVADQRRIAQSLNATLHEIYASRSWRLIQFAQRTRLFFVPHNSMRERTARKILAGLRKIRLFGRDAYGKLVKGIKQNWFTKLLNVWHGNIKLKKLAKKIALIYKEPVLAPPTTSVIIPVYNQIDQTLNCLLSLASSRGHVDYEVIVIDDASTDKTPEFLMNIKGIRYIRNATNMGFLVTCKEAAQQAKGEYLVFLNNDTRVHRDWLDNLLATFSLIPNAGLAGSKLIFPNGKLQEAGGIIWADGSARNYGRNDDPHNYKYNYVREADYVSGASLMLPRALWERLGGFDQQYQPAYYEDVDLAFKVRQAGYKVVYQPFSQVTHHEGASNGVDLSNGTKRYQVINQQKFFNAWQDTIASHGLPAQIPDDIRFNRTAKGYILFIDDGTPRPDRYAGAVLSEFYMIALHESGYAVTFLPHIDLRYAEKYTQALQKQGIECVYQPYISSSQQYIRQNGYRFNYVVISRANVASELIDLVREFAPNARIIFNTIDLHFIRSDRAAQISLRDEDIEIARKAKETELSIIRKADCTLVVSDVEQRLLGQLVPDGKVKVVPFPADLYEPKKSFEERHDIVFLGGFLHKPNVDAVLFFAKEIWPLIAKTIPDGRFVIAGADATKEIRQLESHNIIVKGFVDDLAQLFATAKLSVAPVRFGAGIKGKVLASLGCGVPCVATTIACEGIGLIHGRNVLVADTPEEYANAVINLYTSADLWTTLSEAGQDWIRQNYSRSVVAARLLDVFKEL